VTTPILLEAIRRRLHTDEARGAAYVKYDGLLLIQLDCPRWKVRIARHRLPSPGRQFCGDLFADRARSRRSLGKSQPRLEFESSTSWQAHRQGLGDRSKALNEKAGRPKAARHSFHQSRATTDH